MLTYETSKEQVDDQVYYEVGLLVRRLAQGLLYIQVRSRVWDLIWEQVPAQVRDPVGDQVLDLTLGE